MASGTGFRKIHALLAVLQVSTTVLKLLPLIWMIQSSLVKVVLNGLKMQMTGYSLTKKWLQPSKSMQMMGIRLLSSPTRLEFRKDILKLKISRKKLPTLPKLSTFKCKFSLLLIKISTENQELQCGKFSLKITTAKIRSISKIAFTVEMQPVEKMVSTKISLTLTLNLL